MNEELTKEKNEVNVSGNGNGKLTESEIINLKKLENLSSKCKICTTLPEDLRMRLHKDFLVGTATFEDLADKYTQKLKDRGSDVKLNAVNMHNHLTNHINTDDYKHSIAVAHIVSNVRKDLAIREGEHEGKSIFDLVEEGVIDKVKPITKAVLLSKAKRLENLLNQCNTVSKETGFEPLKVHREIATTENDIFKLTATAVRDFFLDSSSGYDKSLFIVNDLAGKLFMLFEKKQVDYNGDPQKIEALNEIKKDIADLFDQYEKEVDTIKVVD